MQQPERVVSAKRLIEVALGLGHVITRERLARWHKAGLLPRPVQSARAGVRGTVSEYPTHAAMQLRALLQLHEENRRFQAIGWGLWWEGWGVDPKTYVRPPLVRAAFRVAADRVLFALANLLSDTDEAAGDQAFEDIDDYVVATLGTDHTTGDRATIDFVTMMMATMAGTGAPPSERDLHVLESVTHKTQKSATWREAAKRLAVFHAVMKKTDLKQLIETATPTELEAARDNLRVIAKLAVTAGEERGLPAVAGQSARPLKANRVRFAASLVHPLPLLWMLALEQQHKVPEVFGPLRELFFIRKPADLAWE